MITLQKLAHQNNVTLFLAAAVIEKGWEALPGTRVHVSCKQQIAQKILSGLNEKTAKQAAFVLRQERGFWQPKLGRWQHAVCFPRGPKGKLP